MPIGNTEHSPIRIQRRKVRRRQLNENSDYKPGQRIGDGSDVHGGGGPENLNARSSSQAAIPFYQSQPSWAWEKQLLAEYSGPARASITPMVAGMPADAFRMLGDNHRGRQ